MNFVFDKNMSMLISLQNGRKYAFYFYISSFIHSKYPCATIWFEQPGFERLCCMQCIQPQNHTFGGTCICRVPKADLEKGKVIECQHCGCRGCASGDWIICFIFNRNYRNCRKNQFQCIKFYLTAIVSRTILYNFIGFTDCARINFYKNQDFLITNA